MAFATPPGADGEALAAVALAVRELRLEDAEPEIRRLAASYPGDREVLVELAYLEFHLGHYDEAAIYITQAQEGARPSPTVADLGEMMTQTRDALENFVEHRSEDDRYRVRYAPGPDSMLIPYAVEALRAADVALSERLGYRAPGPIRLEIYPTPATLAAVSSLSVEEIERTGTIALCKWDRLMVTSPRALLRGYPWTDTISHELVHLLLARATRDTAPVWFQEGVAKFLERTYRGDPPAAHLGPADQALLRDAVDRQALLPFSQLHPSIARLPSQEAAALAFAQVATFMETFHRDHGAEGLLTTVQALGRGTDAQHALAASAGESFGDLEGRWRDSLASLPRGSAPPERSPLVFRRGPGDPVEQEIAEEEARRFFRLGNLLFTRGRFGGAMREYEKAANLAPADPMIAARLGRAAVAAGHGEVAVDPLLRVLEGYPEYAPLWSALSSARRSAGDARGSRHAAQEALRLNPFDPSPHCDLAEVGASERVQSREARVCRELGGP